MKDCMGKDANWECLTKDTYVRMYDKFKLVRKLLLESSGPICIPEEKGLFIVYGKVSARHNLTFNKEVTQELKAHVGQGHCFLDEIIIDTGKMNEITGGDICPGQQKLLTIEYIVVCDKEIHRTQASSNLHPCLTRYIEDPGTLNPVWRLKRPCFVKEPVIAKDPCVSSTNAPQHPKIIPEACFNRQVYIVKEPTNCLNPCKEENSCNNKCLPDPCKIVDEKPECDESKCNEETEDTICVTEYETSCEKLCEDIIKRRRRRRRKKRLAKKAKLNELCVIRDPCKNKKPKPPCPPKHPPVKHEKKNNMLLFPLFPIHGAYIYPLAPKC